MELSFYKINTARGSYIALLPQGGVFTSDEVLTIIHQPIADANFLGQLELFFELPVPLAQFVDGLLMDAQLGRDAIIRRWMPKWEEGVVQ